jgi:hypothetical protein
VIPVTHPFRKEREKDGAPTRYTFPARVGHPPMRIALNIIGSILVLAGAVWFLQGINLLPGSFMTGQIRWAVYGGIAVVLGIALLLGANRRRKDHR